MASRPAWRGRSPGSPSSTVTLRLGEKNRKLASRSQACRTSVAVKSGCPWARLNRLPHNPRVRISTTRVSGASFRMVSTALLPPRCSSRLDMRCPPGYSTRLPPAASSRAQSWMAFSTSLRPASPYRPRSGMGRAPNWRVIQPRMGEAMRSLSARADGAKRPYSSLITITGSIRAGWLGRNRMPVVPRAATGSIPLVLIR